MPRSSPREAQRAIGEIGQRGAGCAVKSTGIDAGDRSIGIASVEHGQYRFGGAALHHGEATAAPRVAPVARPGSAVTGATAAVIAQRYGHQGAESGCAGVADGISFC